MYGSQLKNLRTVADIPQERLAPRLGMGASKLSAIEQEKRLFGRDEWRDALAVIKAMLKEREIAIRTALREVSA